MKNKLLYKYGKKQAVLISVLGLFTGYMIIVFPGSGYALEDKAAEKGQNTEARALADKLAGELKTVKEAKRCVAEEHYDQAVSFYKNKEYSSALEEFNLVLNIVPGYKKTQSYIAGCRAKIKEAEQRFARSLAAKRKKEVKDILKQALKDCQNNEWSQGLDKFNQVLEIDPVNKTALHHEKIITKKLAKKRDARVWLAQRKKAREDRAAARQLLASGLGYYDRGLYEEAIGQWEKIESLTVPADYVRRKAVVLIVQAQEEQIEQAEKKALIAREIETRSILLNSERKWILPESMHIRSRKIIDKEDEAETEGVTELAEQAKLRVTLSFDNAHLREVLTTLSEVSGINIVLDETLFPADDNNPGISDNVREEAVLDQVEDEIEIEDIELDEDTAKGISVSDVSPRVTKDLNDIPLIDALDIIIRAKGLQYRLENNVIWITTAERLVDKNMVTRIYHLSSGIGVEGLTETLALEETDDD
ncbi:MAG: hypothetical protein KAX15_01325, partial [Candidatus Omnitrophica bacterium]|nr:hypothetical protein [Candidatus Omnitrophota bacterium]